MANGGFALLDPGPHLPAPARGGAAVLVGDRGRRPVAASPTQRLSPEDMVRATRNKLKAEFPDSPDDEIEELARFGVEKHLGRQAAKRAKQLTKPLSRYFGALTKKDNAQTAFMQAIEKLKPKRAEAEAANDPTLWEPYQHQLNAYKMDIDRKTAEAEAFKNALKQQFGIDPKYLESPVSVYTFMNELAGADPHDLGDDEDLLGQEPEEVR